MRLIGGLVAVVLSPGCSLAIMGTDDTIVEFSYAGIVREEPAEIPGPDAECGTAETRRHCPN